MKKTLALIMAAALAGSSLAGCGGKADNSAPETKPAGSEADNGGAAQAEGTAEFPAIGTADAPVTVKVMIKDVFPDEEDVQLLREAINEKNGGSRPVRQFGVYGTAGRKLCDGSADCNDER